MQAATQPRTSAAIDWITGSVEAGWDADQLRVLVERWQRPERDEGAEQRPWTFHGYQGSTVAGYTFGIDRTGRLLVQLTSDAAAEHWLEVAQLAATVSRLDLQVTVWLFDAGVDLSIAAYGAAVAAATQRGKTLHCQLIQSTPVGQTCYLGAPASDKRARLYDKGAERPGPDYAGAWRYELQVRRRPALWLARYLLDCPSVAASVLTTVYDHFSLRGVEPRFARGASPMAGPLPTMGSDDIRRLTWLYDQVRPVVAKLLTRRDRAHVLHALGLPDDASPYRGSSKESS